MEWRHLLANLEESNAKQLAAADELHHPHTFMTHPRYLKAVDALGAMRLKCHGMVQRLYGRIVKRRETDKALLGPSVRKTGVSRAVPSMGQGRAEWPGTSPTSHVSAVSTTKSRLALRHPARSTHELTVKQPRIVAVVSTMLQARVTYRRGFKTVPVFGPYGI